jgi:large subunit ribosomal protein L9
MAHVHVVLREDVQHLGTAGELVRVRAGYARNFLLPRGMVSLATAGNIRQVEEAKRQAIARAAKLKASATALATQLSGLTIEITRQAGEGDRLYGSVTSKDIEAAYAEKGITLDRKQMDLKDPIRTLGLTEVPIRLHADVTALLRVEVVKQT